MASTLTKNKLTSILQSKFNPKELVWINEKTTILANPETSKKFSVFFSLVPKFISDEIIIWSNAEINTIEYIYPGFSKTNWTKQDISRTLLMISIKASVNKEILQPFFQTSEMKEQVTLYKSLYFLENAAAYKNQVVDGIRTNMSNVFKAIAYGNPYPEAYLDEEQWNQMILKTFFMDLNIYPIQNIDQGKNEHLANMLQDYVKERWAAGRKASLEIWRMVDGYLREDLKELINQKKFEGIEREILTKLVNNQKDLTSDFWNKIGREQ